MCPGPSLGGGPISLAPDQARRIAVRAQLLDGSATDVFSTIAQLGLLQLDPTNRVARTQFLVLWSRLGSYDVAEIDRLLWKDHALFEWRAFLYPMSSLPAIRSQMERLRLDQEGASDGAGRWLRVNEPFREYVLKELNDRGPLLSREFEDRAVEPWASTGWTGNRNVSQMLTLLAARGEIAIVGRQGAQRLWDLAERWFPPIDALSDEEVDRWVVRRRLRSLGIALRATVEQPAVVSYTRQRLTNVDVVGDGLAVPVSIDGVAGDWLVDPDALTAMGTPVPPRTTLLSPFDRLIHDRDRTETLFGFKYKLEMYVPKDQRQYGYFVLPALHGDRLVGRVDPEFDRKASVLRVHSLHLEPDAPNEAEALIEGALHRLAEWLGAKDVALP
jgi:uncharacterized protein YcaQ